MPYDPTNTDLNHELRAQEEDDKVQRLLEPYELEIAELNTENDKLELELIQAKIKFLFLGFCLGGLFACILAYNIFL